MGYALADAQHTQGLRPCVSTQNRLPAGQSVTEAHNRTCAQRCVDGIYIARLVRGVQAAVVAEAEAVRGQPNRREASVNEG